MLRPLCPPRQPPPCARTRSYSQVLKLMEVGRFRAWRRRGGFAPPCTCTCPAPCGSIAISTGVAPHPKAPGLALSTLVPLPPCSTKAPGLALSYYGLSSDASLRDALLRMRADEVRATGRRGWQGWLCSRCESSGCLTPLRKQACIEHIDHTFAGLHPCGRTPFVTTTSKVREE